jgi:hypothetical protein
LKEEEQQQQQLQQQHILTQNNRPAIIVAAAAAAAAATYCSGSSSSSSNSSSSSCDHTKRGARWHLCLKIRPLFINQPVATMLVHADLYSCTFSKFVLMTISLFPTGWSAPSLV